jgi:hypothetical protein
MLTLSTLIFLTNFDMLTLAVNFILIFNFILIEV